jgi:hypothetical protein
MHCVGFFHAGPSVSADIPRAPASTGSSAKLVDAKEARRSLVGFFKGQRTVGVFYKGGGIFHRGTWHEPILFYNTLNIYDNLIYPSSWHAGCLSKTKFRRVAFKGNAMIRIQFYFLGNPR